MRTDLKGERPSLWPLVTLAIVFLAFGLVYLAIKLSGYVAVPHNRLMPVALSTVITAAMVFLTVIGVLRNARSGKKPLLLASLMPLCAVIFVVGKGIGYVTDGTELFLLPAYGIIALACSMVLFFACVRPALLRIGLGAVYSLVMIPMIAVLLLWDFAPQPVVKTELSPDGSYQAEVIQADQGVFGSTTLVCVVQHG